MGRLVFPSFFCVGLGLGVVKLEGPPALSLDMTGPAAVKIYG